MTYTDAQIFDVIIIGGGPAGAQCGLWLKMLGYNPVILEKADKLGGLQLLNPHENHWTICVPGHIGAELAEAMQANINRHGVAHILNVSDLRIERKDHNFHATFDDAFGAYQMMAPKIVIATGVRHKDGGLTASDRVIIGSGQVIEDQDFTNLNVAILGGGDSAAEAYSFVLEKGARSVDVYARTLRARKQIHEKIPEGHLRVGGYEVDEAKAMVNGKAYDKLCVMYGWRPVNPLPDSIPIKLDERGFIDVDENYRTSDENIFAIGECAQRVHPCMVTAMADGVVAAKALQSDFESE